MLWDPNKDKPIVEVELDSISQHILRAADYVEKHGWCQNTLQTPDGRVCLQGALMLTDPNNAQLNWVTPHYNMADRRVRQHLSTISNYVWNDHPNRTKEEVVKVLREAAYLGA